MSEANIQRAIQAALEARGCIVMKHHASQYTGRGWPDLWVCLPDRWIGERDESPILVPGGQLAVLETKTPAGRATKIQLRKMAKLVALGALGGFPTSVAEALAICGLD